MRDSRAEPLVALVVPECPYPAQSGNALRDQQTTEVLRRLGFQIVIVGVRPRPGSTATADSASAAAHGARLELISDQGLPLVESLTGLLRRKLTYFLPGNTAHPFAWWTNPYELGQRLPERLAGLQPSAVVLRSIFVDLLPAMRRRCLAPLVVDCHDADVDLADEMVRSVPWWRSPGPRANRHGVRRVSRTFLPQADEIWAVSTKDADRIRADAAAAPVHVVPSAVDERSIATAADPGCDDVAAIVANYAYGPNLTGLRWILRDVWPRLRRARPAARLLVVGGGGDAAGTIPDRDGVHRLGRVDDLAPIYAEAGVLLCPLFHGGGSRLKVVEAWRHGKAVLGTPKGLDGIPAPPGVALVAATADEFAATLTRLFANRDERGRLGEVGRRFVGEVLTFSAVRATLARHSILTSVAPVPSGMHR